jgi:transcription initiation factor TFIIB
MRCKECSGNKFTFDDLLGERVCDSCGLVIVEEIFEKTQTRFYTNHRSGINYGDTHTKETDNKTGGLGSHIGTVSNRIESKLKRTAKRYTKTSYDRTVETGIRYCMFVISEYPISHRIKEQVSKNYVNLLRNHHLRGWTYEERAGAIAFYTLKDNSIRTSIKEIAKYSGADTNRVHKLARKIARVFHRPWVLSQTNTVGEIEKYCQDLKQDFNFTKSCLKVYSSLVQPFEQHNKQFNLYSISTIIYITSLLTDSNIRQLDICEMLGVTETTIRANLRAISKILGITKKPHSQYLRGITLEEFIYGVFK